MPVPDNDRAVFQRVHRKLGRQLLRVDAAPRAGCCVRAAGRGGGCVIGRCPSGNMPSTQVGWSLHADELGRKQALAQPESADYGNQHRDGSYAQHPDTAPLCNTLLLGHFAGFPFVATSPLLGLLCRVLWFGRLPLSLFRQASPSDIHS